MPSVLHGLGELEHIYDKYNLKLKTKSCITLSSSPSLDSAFSFNIQDLDTLICSGTWVSGVNRLLLHVQLLFDDIGVSGSSLSQVTEDIGAILCNAELWSQLCLDASLTINESNKLFLSLSAQASNVADIKPPECTPSTFVEDISMLFCFSTCRRTRNTSRALFAVSEIGTHHDATSTNLIDEQCVQSHYPPLSSSGGSRETLMDTYAPWGLPTPSIGTLPVSSQESISFNGHCTSSLNMPTGHKYATHQVKLEVLVKLLDFSFRRMISDYRLVRPGGIVLSSDAGCPKLAAISPALFSPGYVKAVSQRTALLPTIVRSFSRIYRRTDSSRLRCKLKQLQDASIGDYSDRVSMEDTDSSSDMFSSAVEARLWFLTKSKLIDPLACKALKSLSIFNRTGFSDGAEGVMLDGDEDTILDTIGDAMELDSPNLFDLPCGNARDEVVDKEEDFLDDDLFWEHSQEEIEYDSAGTLDGKSTFAVYDDLCSAFRDNLHPNLGMVRYS